MLLVLLLLLAPSPTIEIALESAGTRDAALFVRVKNPPGHRPIALLREFWKFDAVHCALSIGGNPVSPAYALRPDRPSLAQLVVLEPGTEYGERLGLARVWGPGALEAGPHHVECSVGVRAAVTKLYESSIQGGAKRAGPGLAQDLRRIDVSLGDLKSASFDFSR